MSDKISDDRLAHILAAEIASSKGQAFIGHPSYEERIAIIDELIARRAADLPPAVTLPEAIIYDLRVPPYVGYAYPKAKTDAALKAAGITVQDNSNDKIR